MMIGAEVSLEDLISQNRELSNRVSLLNNELARVEAVARDRLDKLDKARASLRDIRAAVERAYTP